MRPFKMCDTITVVTIDNENVYRVRTFEYDDNNSGAKYMEWAHNEGMDVYYNSSFNSDCTMMKYVPTETQKENQNV